MKTRFDFVSNSSSCSFFIEFDTVDSVEAFRKICKSLKNYNAYATAYENFDRVCNYDPYSRNIDHIEKIVGCGNWMLLDSGEDHDEDYRERFDNMVDIIDNNPAGYKFKIYEDPSAHMTHWNAMEFPNEDTK